MTDKKVAVSHHPEREGLICRLEDAQNEQRHLTEHLRLSFIIEAIWPSAFDHGSVRFSGIQKWMSNGGLGRPTHGFTRAWFKNEKVQYFLTRSELHTFKPEAIIHPKFVGGDQDENLD